MADAKITIGADASAVDKAFASMLIGANAFKSAFKDAIGSTARALANDFAQVGLAAGRISFTSQQQQVKDFEAATARLSVASGASLGKLRSEFEATGVAIGKRPGEIADWVNQVGRLTYSFGDAKDAAEAMSGFALQTGRSFEEYTGLATSLEQAGVAGKDTAKILGLITAQAKQVGLTGGPAALADQLAAAGDAMTRLSDRSEKGVAKISGLFTAIGAKAGSPQAAMRVQQTALGVLTSDPLRWERYLGRRITDEAGHVKDPTKVLADIVAKAKRTFGADARRVMMQGQNFGAEAGSVLFGLDFKEAERLSNVKPSEAPKKAQEQYNKTDQGQRDIAAAELAASSRDLLGSSSKLGRASDALQKFAGSHPIASTFATSVAGMTISNILGKVAGSLISPFGGEVQKVVVGDGAAKAALGDLAKSAIGTSGAVGALGAKLGGFGATMGAVGAGATAAAAALGYLGVRDKLLTGIDTKKAATTLREDLAAGRKRAVDRGFGITSYEDVKGAAEQRKAAADYAAKQRELRGERFVEPVPFSPMLANVSQAQGPLYSPGQQGRPDALADSLQRAIADVLKNNVKVTIVNGTGGPIEAVDGASQSSYSGNMSGG